MSLIAWEASYRIGLEPFDGHHRRLVELLNEIYRTVMDRDDDDRLRDIFGELIAYCDYHFRAEEQWMAARDFPHLAGHVENHRKFLRDILDFQQQFCSDRMLISFGLLKYLRDWLLTHILNEDKLMGTFQESPLAEAPRTA